MAGSPPAPPQDVRTALDEIVFKPWVPVQGPLQALATVASPSDEKALAILKKAERSGLWGDGDSASLQDLALLRHALPSHASLDEAAEGYAALLETEKKAHSDATPHARLAALEIAPRLQPGESMKDAAAVYASLLRFESGRDINGSEHARAAFARVDRSLVGSQTRMVAAQEYMRDPETFENRQAAEKERFEARQAEVRRVAEQVSREPRADARIEQESEAWIIVGGVRVPRKT